MLIDFFEVVDENQRVIVIKVKKLRYKDVTENVKQLSSSNKSKKSAYKASQVSKLNIKEVKE